MTAHCSEIQVKKTTFKFFSLTKTKEMETLIYLILYTKANSKNLKSGRGYLEDTA